jgi:FtsH-binding integral membrane protein
MSFGFLGTIIILIAVAFGSADPVGLAFAISEGAIIILIGLFLYARPHIKKLLKSKGKSSQ